MIGKPIIVQPPHAGLDRAWGYQSQPPFTMADGSNVRCRDTFENRMRLGSRPMLAAAYPTTLGSGNPVRLLDVCRTLNADGSTTFNDLFAGVAMSGDWAHGGWTLDGNASVAIPLVDSGQATTDPLFAGAELRTALLSDRLASTNTYREIVLEVNPTRGNAYILMDMDNVTPVPAASFMLRGRTADVTGYRTLTLYQDDSAVATFTDSSGPFSVYQFMRLSIDSSGVVRGYWRSQTVSDIEYPTSGYIPAGRRVGFGLFQEAASIATAASSFTFMYSASAGGLPPRALVASANGLLYRENTSGAMTVVSSSLTLASDRLLSSTNRLQTLFIADYKERQYGTNASLSYSAPNGTLTDTTGGGTFITNGVTVLDDRLEIISGSGATVGIYAIVSRTATTVVFTGDAGTVGSGVTYRVVRGPKQFDSATLTLTLMPIGTIGAGLGQCPVGCTIVAVWLDRLIWSGDPRNPHVAYFSAAGDPYDYAYANDTPGEAFAFDPAKQGGASQIGDAVTAVIPHSDDYVLFCGQQSVSLLRGDPTFGGQLDLVTRDVGILDKKAWCYTPEQVVLGMSTDGLYLFQPGPGAQPQRVSRERIPQELININTALYDVQLAYDLVNQGVNIFVTPKTIGPTSHWWFDWNKKGFFHEGYNASLEATAAAVHAVGGSGSRNVIIGSRTGSLLRYSDSQTQDVGVTVSSNCLLGPFSLGHPVSVGLLHTVIVDLSRTSGNILVEVLVGDTPEEARHAAASDSFTATAGSDVNWLLRLRGGACFLRLSSTTRWAVETIALSREIVGMRRAEG